MVAAVLDDDTTEIAPVTESTSPAEIPQGDEALAVQLAAERSFVRCGLVGGVIGVLAGAVIWVGLVAISLIGSGWPLAGPLWMAAVVGMFAGSFLGSWAGVMVGTIGLERTEHELRPGHIVAES